MPNGKRRIANIVETYIDILLNIIAIIISYFFAIIIREEQVVPLNNPVTLLIIAFNLLCITFVYTTLNMYRPNRYARKFRSIYEPLRANLLYYGALAAIIAFLSAEGYTDFFLYWTLFAFILSTAFLTFKRHLIKALLLSWRTRRIALRKIIIVGDNTVSAREYAKQVAASDQLGTMILGYVGDRTGEDVGIEKLGGINNLPDVLDKYKPTDVVFAIDAYDKRRIINLVNQCDDRCIKVYFLPVIYGFFKTSRQIEQVGSIPVINIHSTPLDNATNAALKRAVDILGSLALIVMTAPIMLVTAIGVRLSSPGPIFFRQIRVGKMGKKFMMLKFRSMRVNSLSNKGWTTDTDSRKTKFGNFIRKTSIDELPQLFNVLRGDMSLVGPRPEIPVFVEQFKETIPLYMVKHYVKPGMTGLAQIKGLRGDTSVEDRIHEDIEYIENWTFWLDIYILFKTPMKAVNKNEKYVEAPVEGELLDDETTRDFVA
jgi:Undecaprenyl-phosphate glucose phosphotransferase